MPDQKRYLRIALPVPLRKHFDYLPPGDLSSAQIAMLQPGLRVEVPFGKQALTGLLLEVLTRTDVADDKLKTAHGIIDSSPLIPTSMLELIVWAARYYQHPEGDALLSVLPTLLREGQPATRSTETWWRLTAHGKGLPAGALKRSVKQAQLLERLQQSAMSQLEAERLAISRAIIRELHKKQLIEPYEKEISLTDTSAVNSGNALLAETPLSLNREQLSAVEQICAAKKFQPFLLQGVTGSGKTEVYLQVIEKILQQNRQALVLVPEIGLTPQTIARFRKRFNRPVVAFHSGLNNRERLDAWLQAARNEASIVIGTRSSIFTPMPALGVIIVDEEHDSSFKQQDGFHYHARDVAMVRAQREKIPIVLGSATPSLESLHNAIQQRYEWLRLGKRAGNAKPPQMMLIDSRHQTLNEGFSAEALDAIQTTLKRGEQVLVYLNRRGFAPVLICADCSWMGTCPHCDTRMTVHKRLRQLRCHHCDFQQVLPRHCPSCHSPRLDFVGLGTQRSEDMLTTMFPHIPVLRIDRDSTARKEAMNTILNEIQRGEPTLLIGTQMIAKGHHFPDVTLVVILDADAGLFSSDFRSAEKFGQLLTQVAGRAGRAGKTGLVMLQSRLGDHPLLQTLLSENYEGLARQLLGERKTLALPPFRQQAILRSETTDPHLAQHFLQNLREWLAPQLTEFRSTQLIGPVPSLMEKRASFYRYELIFSSTQRPTLQQLLSRLTEHIEQLPASKKIRWSVDVDPV
jgi:primosomal protein N' (replication factor Y)